MNDTPKPPDGYEMWLDYAVEAMPTRCLYHEAIMNDEEWQREDFRKAVRGELNALRAAAGGKSWIRRRITLALAMAVYCSTLAGGTRAPSDLFQDCMTGPCCFIDRPVLYTSCVQHDLDGDDDVDLHDYAIMQNSKATL